MEKFDFIGEVPNLYIKGNPQYRTRLGGCLCAIMMAFVISASGYFSREIWEKKNPLVNSVEVALTVPEEISWDKEDFEFIFTLRKINDYVIRPNVVRISSTLFTYSKEKGSYVQTPFALETCTESSFSASNLPLIANLGVAGKFLCLPKTEMSKGLGLFKNYGEDGFKMINIQFYPCTNSTSSSITCDTQENINTFLSNLYLTTYVLDLAVDTNNYANPTSKAFRNEFTTVSITSFTSFNIYHKPLYVISDIGFLFEQIHNIQKQKFDSSKFLYSSTPNPSGMFAELGIQLRGNKLSFFRKYLKIQDLMAQIGGIANLFLIIIKLLNSLPAHSDVKIYLFNKFFDLPDPNSVSLKAWLSKHKDIKVSSVNLKQKDHAPQNDLEEILTFKNQQIIKDNSVSHFVSKVNENENYSKLHVPQFELHTGMSASLKYLTSSTKTDFSKHVVEKTFREVQNNISIEAYLSMLRVVTKLKYFLLSNRENILFDNLGNPMVISDETQKRNSFTQYSDYLLNFSFYNKDKREFKPILGDDCKRKIEDIEELFHIA